MNQKENLLRLFRHETPGFVPFRTEGIVPLFHRDALFYQQNGDPELLEWTDAWGVGFKLGIPSQRDSGFPVSHPLTDLDDLDAIPWPDPADPGLMAGVEQILGDTDRETHLVMGMNPGAMFVRAWLLAGMENLLIHVATAPKKVAALLDRIADYQVAVAHRYVELGVDIGNMGDDAGMNLALFMNPALWRKLIKPRLKSVVDVYKNAGCFFHFHCCGRVMDILDDLFEIGVDILNPLQAGANDLAEVRRRTQGKMTLHGGINCHIVATATPEEVARLTTDVVLGLGQDGEYIADTDQGLPFPPENIDAMRKVVRDIGTYPLGTTAPEGAPR